MWVGVVLLIELAAFTLWKRWYWFFPTHAVSEVYSRYAGTDGLNVVFLKDFKVNDTLLLDVTLLEAKDSAGWATLKRDFGIPAPSPIFQQRIDEGKDLIHTKKVPKVSVTDSHPNTYPYDMLAISHLNRTIIVCHVESEAEKHAVIYRNLDKSLNR